MILDGTWPNDYPDAPINFTLEAFHNKEYAAVGRTKLANDLQAEARGGGGGGCYAVVYEPARVASIIWCCRLVKG